MFDKIFGTIGGILGNSIGGGIFTSIGRALGGKIGHYLDDSSKEIDEQYRDKYILDKFVLKQEIYGLPIPIIYGQSRISGKIIWTDQLSEIPIESIDTKYFDSGIEKSITHNIEYKYFLSFAIGICEGEIKDIARIWNGNELIDISLYNFRLYKGSENQGPDPLIESIIGKDSCPAFRGLAYIVFEKFPLQEFNNALPNFSFEVLRKIDLKENILVEDLIDSIVMIPGSGEYVYDTETQYKYMLSESGNILAKDPINSHNYKKIANSLFSLDQLEFTCKNIKWIAPVVCWFTDDINIKNCSIFPAIEFGDSDKKYSEKWKVGEYYRHNAKIISKDEKNNPHYGGSINDASIIRYLDELRSRNFKIMFYPMIFVDLPGKPWRGHITGDASDIYKFFNRKDGYNDFILHYANLVKNKVDAFIIGSELIGITKIRDINNNFPAITELINLAKAVKEILGPTVKISYAADWSEYHHTDGGWHNLDPLWASDYIDFIGIDAYFPITSATSNEISDEEILKGFSSGIGYEFYYDQNNQKQSLDAKYAWKNIAYWWNNKHYNPNGQTTSWEPRSKNIWFTEFGFPSIDKATNQPNIFFNPKCLDGGVPRHSSGETDFAIQRRAIKIAIEYFKTCDFLENYFLWTWDARPYPAWPYMNVWTDGNLWEKGHWVNNKLSAVNLSSLIKVLCDRAQIDFNKIDVSSLDDSIEGVIFDRDIRIIDAINILRITYLFDIESSYGNKIHFVKRGCNTSYQSISSDEFAITDNNIFKINNACKSERISEINIFYQDPQNEYRKEFFKKSIDSVYSYNQVTLRIPIVLSISELNKIACILLDHSNYENEEIIFHLPLFYRQILPTNIVMIK